VAGIVFADQDRDGVIGPAEHGLADVEVTLRPAGLISLAGIFDTTRTDADGRYVFAALAPATYIVGVIPPAGYYAAGGAEQIVEVAANRVAQADFPLRAYIRHYLPVMTVRIFATDYTDFTDGNRQISVICAIRGCSSDAVY
jgi:hypothetical protein